MTEYSFIVYLKSPSLLKNFGSQSLFFWIASIGQNKFKGLFHIMKFCEFKNLTNYITYSKCKLNIPSKDSSFHRTCYFTTLLTNRFLGLFRVILLRGVTQQVTYSKRKLVIPNEQSRVPRILAMTSECLILIKPNL